MGAILPPHKTLARTTAILGYNQVGPANVAYSRVWHLGRTFLEGWLSWDSWASFSPSGLYTVSPTGYLDLLYIEAPNVYQGSQKHRSGSCQGFLRLRPTTGTSSIFCWLRQDTSHPRLSVEQDQTRTWIWGGVIHWEPSSESSYHTSLAASSSLKIQ